MPKETDYFTMKPDIRIEPYCVFCKGYTKNTEKYLYQFPYIVYNRFYRVLIKFPSHRRCYRWQKAKYLLGFCICLPMFFLVSFLSSRYLFTKVNIFGLPKWFLFLVGLISLITGIIMGLRLFFGMEEKIHLYYVLHEELEEADKSWRIEAERRFQEKEKLWK
jgi:hypothetical protein